MENSDAKDPFASEASEIINLDSSDDEVPSANAPDSKSAFNTIKNIPGTHNIPLERITYGNILPSQKAKKQTFNDTIASNDFEADIPVNTVLVKPTSPPPLILYENPEQIPSNSSLNRNTFDLNVNISNVNTSSSGTPVVNTAPSTHRVTYENVTRPETSNSQYNVALGLVLNVNDQNKNPFTASSSNVALDVSVNMNNKKSRQRKQSIKSHVISKRIEITPKTADTDIIRKTFYRCKLCLLESLDLNSVVDLPCLQKDDHHVSKYNLKKNVYSCGACSFKALTLNELKLHLTSHWVSADCCPACNFKSDDPQSMRVHVSNCTSMKKTYKNIFCCSNCTYETDNMNSFDHACDGSKKTEPRVFSRKKVQMVTFRRKSSKKKPRLGEVSDSRILLPEESAIKNAENDHSNLRSLLNEEEDNKTQETIYACANCSFQINNINDVDHTCNAESDQKLEESSMLIYSCANCNYQSQDLNIFKSHACSTESAAVPSVKQPPQKFNMYKCFICGFENSDINALASHACTGNRGKQMLQTVIQGPCPLYMCQTCNFQTSDIGNFSLHVCKNSEDTSHQPRKEGTETSSQSLPAEKSYSCRVCDYRSTDIGDFSLHVCNIQTDSQPPRKRRVVDNESSKNVSRMFQCSVCSYKTLDPAGMSSHDCGTSKAGSLPSGFVKLFCCSGCSFKTIDVTAIKSHVCSNIPNHIVQPEKIYKCDICLFKTSDIALFITHACRNTVLQEPVKSQFCCSVCSYTTNGMNALESHVCEGNPLSSIKIQNVSTVISEEESSEVSKCTVPDIHFSHPCSSKKSQEITPVVPNSNSASTHHNFLCKNCPFKTTEKLRFQLHKCEARRETSLATKIQISQESQANDDVSDTVIHCNRCSYCTRYKSSMKVHAELHSDTTAWVMGCDRCSFNTRSKSAMRRHKCPPGVPGPKYTCISCTFATEDLAKANAHKCSSTLVNGPDGTVFKYGPGFCKLCHQFYSTNAALFSHVMTTHFPIEKIMTCVYCHKNFGKTNLIFESVKAFTNHFNLHHYGKVFNENDMCLYKCVFCHLTMDLTYVKSHFQIHFSMPGCKSLMDIFHQYFDNFLKKINSPEFQSQLTKANDELNKRKTCAICFQVASDNILKCVNSDCDCIFHITCCNRYSTEFAPEEISDNPYWFCESCSKENQNISTAHSTVEEVDFCLSLSDQLLLKEVKTQKLMLQEIERIKDEKLGTQREFDRIKSFILKSESERINNPMVNGVCNIIEKFIKAGVDQ